MRLRFPDSSQPDAAIGPGLHGIGRSVDGALSIVPEGVRMLAQLCVDRRGTWLKLTDGARTVHVNGRPVKHMAMLRIGDAIYIDGREALLLGAKRDPEPLPAPGGEGGDARVLLRGVGGQYHGRSFTLDRPRLIGRGVECDIRIDDQAFPERHARIDVQQGRVVLRGINGAEPSLVNGEVLRDAVLRTGDQVVFDAHHRFVVESPGRPALVHDAMAPPLPDDIDFEHSDVQSSKPRRKSNARRLPWLLVAALLMAAALSAILLFGSPSG